MTRRTHDHTQAGARRLGRLVVGALLLSALALAGVGPAAWAYWTSAGQGAGSATTATLNPPTDVVASVTPGVPSAQVTWTASAGLAPEGYYVTRTRIGGASEPACGSSPTALIGSPCLDSPLADGSYRYTVTAVHRSWTSTSGNSNTVTVAADTTAPVVTVTSVNGAVRSFPYSTNASVSTIGGACGTAPGDSASVTPLLNGSATSPSTATCASGVWTLTLDTAVSATGPMTLSATQVDGAGNTGTAPTQTVIIDTTRPTVVSIVRAGPSPAVNTGPLSWTVTFSEPVTGVQASNFALVMSGIGGVAPSINSVVPTGGPLSATWTVSTNATGATGTNTGSIRLDLTGIGSVADAATNLLSTAAFLGQAYAYDTAAPTVTGVSSTLPNGSYRAGQVVPVTVTFSEPVTVGGTGTPQLTLATGNPPASAVSYTSGSGGSILTFEYTVAAGNTSADLDYVATTALGLNSATIRDAASNPATLTLPAPGAAGSLGATKALVIDTAPPAVAVTRVGGTVRTFPYYTRNNVTSVGGTCGAATGDLAPVTVLVNGTSAGTVNCSAGAWTLTTSWTTNGTRIVSATQADVAGNIGTAPEQSVIVDKTRPTLLSITRAGASQAVSSGPLVWTATFSEPVSGVAASNFTTVRSGITGTPTISGVSAVGGSPSATWTVSVGVTGVTGTNAGSIGLNLVNRGSVADPAGNTLVTTGLTGQAYTYDTTKPTVSAVSSPLADGRYGVGQVLPITVTFSEPVTVTATPQLALATGSPATTAAPYGSGSGSTTLTFEYTVGAGNTSADLDYAATTSLALNAGSITDAATNAATLTLAAPGAAGSLGAAKALVIDGTPPAVVGVSSPLANGSYRSGQVVPVTVTFSEAVTVTGTPQLTLTTGTPATTAVDHTSGSGTTTLTFAYTVAAGDASGDLDYAATTSLALNGGTISDAAGNPATLTLSAPGAAGSLGASKALVIDTAPPAVTVARVNGAPQTFPLVTGAIVTSIGGTCGTAAGDSATVTPRINGAATSPSSTTCLSGAWTLTLATALTTSGTWTLSATQADGAGNTGVAPDQTVILDTTRPTVVSIVRAGPSQAVRSGPLSWTVTFSEPVSGVATADFGLVSSGISGTPTISSASAVDGPPGATWTVSVDVTGVSGSDSGSIRLDLTSSGSVVDAVGNTLSTTALTGQAYTYDTTGPTVTGVSSTLPDGNYGAGQVVPVVVAFSEPVTVGGTPQLTLATGSPVATAVDYTTGSGGTALTFEYTVVAGNTSADLDYVTATSLALDGGAIADGAGNPATLTLPVPGATGSLGTSGALVIDTTPPEVEVTAMSSQTILLWSRVRVSGTAESGAGPLTVYLCYGAGPSCDAGSATQTFTNVAVATDGSWLTGWSSYQVSGTWYASATQTDAAGNVGTSAVFGPYTN